MEDEFKLLTQQIKEILQQKIDILERMKIMLEDFDNVEQMNEEFVLKSDPL